MPKTRSRKPVETVHPYERSPSRRYWPREPSFTEWKDKSEAAIIHITEILDEASGTPPLVHDRKLIYHNRNWRYTKKKKKKKKKKGHTP
jgi:hypothetical protein